MKISYFVNKSFPTNKANNVQIISMCDAFQLSKVETVLIGFKSVVFSHSDNIFERFGTSSHFELDLLSSVTSFFSGEVSLIRKLWRERKKHQNIYTRSSLLALAAKFLGKCVIHELHDFAKPWWYRYLYTLLARRLNYVVVISRRLEQELRERGVQNILCLPDGVNSKKFKGLPQKSELRRQLNLPKNKKILLYTGTFNPSKGLPTVLESLKYFPKTTRNSILLVVIGGDQISIAKARHNLRNHVDFTLFTGHQDHRLIPAYLKAADILLLPNTGREESVVDRISKFYTSPMKLFEYMASGNPIIASDIPAIREILDDATAILIKPDSPKALASAAITLIREANKAKELAENALRRSKKYTWTRRAKRIIRLYEGCA